MSGIFVFDWPQSASVLVMLELPAFTVTLYSAVHRLQPVASGLVTLAGSADGILLSSEKGSRLVAGKMASPTKGKPVSQ
jgi:hypothetical protein